MAIMLPFFCKANVSFSTTEPANHRRKYKHSTPIPPPDTDADWGILAPFFTGFVLRATLRSMKNTDGKTLEICLATWHNNT